MKPHACILNTLPNWRCPAYTFFSHLITVSLFLPLFSYFSPSLHLCHAQHECSSPRNSTHLISAQGTPRPPLLLLSTNVLQHGHEQETALLKRAHPLNQGYATGPVRPTPQRPGRCSPWAAPPAPGRDCPPGENPRSPPPPRTGPAMQASTAPRSSRRGGLACQDVGRQSWVKSLTHRDGQERTKRERERP